MKKTLYVLFLLITTVAMTANAREGRGVKIEPYIGLSVPIRNIGGTEIKEVPGVNIGIEINKRLSSSPFMVGADIFASTAVRQKAKETGGQSTNSQRMVGVAAVFDYYFHHGKFLSAFVGTGLGLAQRNTISSDIDNSIGICPSYGPVISPRIGVELWNHVRFSIEARITQRDYNIAAFRIGYSFGK